MKYLEMYIGELTWDKEGNDVITFRNGGYPIRIPEREADDLSKKLSLIGYLCRDDKSFPISEEEWEDCSYSNVCNFKTYREWMTVIPTFIDEEDEEHYGIIVLCEED